MKSTANTDPLTVHRGVLATVGPQGLADITRSFTPAELALIESKLADRPLGILALAALNEDGTTRDQAALDALKQVAL